MEHIYINVGRNIGGNHTCRDHHILCCGEHILSNEWNTYINIECHGEQYFSGREHHALC